MVRAAIYARCSTEEESQRDALKAQAEEAREWVRKKGWELAEEYIESRSGTSTRGRNEYRRLYEDLSKNKFEIVVIKSQDRLMRNTKDWYLFIDRLTMCEKKLFLYLEQKFYSPDDGLLTGIKAILAEDYSRELSKKINNAHYNRQKNGTTVLITGNTYGYRKLPDKSVVIDEEEAAIKRNMYELCAAGYGSRKISAILREKGIVNRKGNPFSDSDIRRMIRNPINKGTVIMRKTHFDFDSKRTIRLPEEEQFVFENRIPAIVSKELWQKANDQISARYKKNALQSTQQAKGYGWNRGKSCLSGKLCCGICGKPYYRRQQKSKNQAKSIPVWSCSVYLQQGGCRNLHIKEDDFYDFLMENITVFPDDWTERISDKAKYTLKKLCMLEETQAQLYLEDKKKQIQKQMQLLLDKLLNNVISDEIYKQRQEKLEKALSELSQRKEESFISPEKNFKNLEIQIYKAMIQCLLRSIESICIYPDKLEIRKDKKIIVLLPEEEWNYYRKKQREREKIIKLIEKNPYITAKKISELMGISLSCVQYRIRILKRDGLICFCGSGGKGYWKIKSTGSL